MNEWGFSSLPLFEWDKDIKALIILVGKKKIEKLCFKIYLGSSHLESKIKRVIWEIINKFFKSNAEKVVLWSSQWVISIDQDQNSLNVLMCLGK